MYAVFLASKFYSGLATAVLFLHGLFIVWVIFGALLVRRRPMLLWLHSFVAISLVDIRFASPIFAPTKSIVKISRTQRTLFQGTRTNLPLLPRMS
jgi:hypothetical protein